MARRFMAGAVCVCALASCGGDGDEPDDIIPDPVTPSVPSRQRLASIWIIDLNETTSYEGFVYDGEGRVTGFRYTNQSSGFTDLYKIDYSGEAPAVMVQREGSQRLIPFTVSHGLVTGMGDGDVTYFYAGTRLLQARPSASEPVAVDWKDGVFRSMTQGDAADSYRNTYSIAAYDSDVCLNPLVYLCSGFVQGMLGSIGPDGSAEAVLALTQAGLYGEPFFGRLIAEASRRETDGDTLVYGEEYSYEYLTSMEGYVLQITETVTYSDTDSPTVRMARLRWS